MMRPAIKIAVGAVLLAACFHAQAQRSSPERIAAFAELPDWSGLWEPTIFVGEGIGQSLSEEGLAAALPIMGAEVPFNDEWQARYEAAVAARQAAIAADPDHPPAPTYNNCGSPPFILNMMSPAIYQWRITPEETTIVDTIGGIRHIYTDGRSHPPADELWPTRTGDSVGRWDGDTLIVDTVSVRPDVHLPNFVSVQMSDQLRFGEQMRMVSEDVLQIEFTMEDRVAMTEPFTVTLEFARVKEIDRMIDETECDVTTDRNPIVDGRFTTITAE